VKFEFPDSSECKDTGVTSVVKYKFLSFFATPLMLGFSVDSGDALFRSVHCIDTNGRWLTVVNGYGKALGVNSWQAQEFCSSLVYAYCVDNLPSYPGGVKAAGA